MISKTIPEIRIEQNIFWAEHDKKSSAWKNLDAPKLNRVEAEKCYSIDDETESSKTGWEMDYQGFLRFSNPSTNTGAFAVVSHGTHGYSRRENRVRLNILRSPSYGTHANGRFAQIQIVTSIALSPARTREIASHNLPCSSVSAALTADATTRGAALSRPTCHWIRLFISPLIARTSE